ncbi:MAG: DUF1549 domain-containing protein [Verrucomicrobiota bacterium]|nr:DUF1549 domain-containing protein [Verrucomicrobiota bacterium]
MKAVFPVTVACAGLLLALPGGIRAELSAEQKAKLPPPAAHKVNFSKEIFPLLEQSCAKCHGKGKAKGGFSLETREQLLAGGDTGASVVVGNSAGSYLVELVSGIDPDNIMPQKGSKFTTEQVGLVRAWIDQGLRWEEGANFAKAPVLNLKPNRPELPGPEVGHPIDRLLKPYFEKHSVKTGAVVSDRIFVRRVYLDTIGLLPPVDELEAFVMDADTGKRRKLVRRLLDDRKSYAEHWLAFWNDILRNDYAGTGYIDGGRKQITGWLYGSLFNNKPYDRFVYELVNPTEHSQGFTKGIVWRGVVNASQKPQMQAAQHISQIFMGVNLKCASCHDSFINDWSLADAYALASVYADKPLEMVECDKPTGEISDVRFIHPELGGIDPKADKSTRIRQLAEAVTSPNNGRLSRTIVNRLWARFLGRGLVEPVDEMEKESWNTDLLDLLASDLVDNEYDLKFIMEQIMTSRAYQMPAVNGSEQAEKEFVFRGPLVRRMSAEQFVDAVATLTDNWKPSPAKKIEFDGASLDGVKAGVDRADLPSGRWIWSTAKAANGVEPGTVYFRKTVELPDRPTTADVIAVADNSFVLLVNQRNGLAGKNWEEPQFRNLAGRFQKGKNLIAVSATNEGSGSNPAGLWLGIRFEFADGTTKDVVSDKSWKVSTEGSDDWNKPDFDVAKWSPASELGGVDMAPWGLAKRMNVQGSVLSFGGRFRESFQNKTALTTALGRPNREQVTTERPSVATTLQALALTNGEVLSSLIKEGAAALADGREKQPGLAKRLFRAALGRPPSQAELAMLVGLGDGGNMAESVEDVLWAVTMLPEFQLIY